MTTTYVPGLALVKKEGETLTVADLGKVSDGFLTTESLADALGEYVSLSESGETVGSGTQPVYVEAGAATASTASVGNTAKPVYLASGVLTAISDTVGSDTVPVFLNNGKVTASSSTVGSGVNPVYLNAGTTTASSSTVGSGTQPVYMSSGSVTASSSTVGSSTTPVYLDAGVLTACSTSLDSSAASGYPTVKQATLSSKKFYAPSGGTWWCCGCYTYSRSAQVTRSGEDYGYYYTDNVCVPVAVSVAGGGLIATSSYTVLVNGISCIQIAS